ncbi:MAG: hypothetical protein JWM44_4199 [Bacilli bacterium]|nr:hypothetical protein [Bacilli bacterium]
MILPLFYKDDHLNELDEVTLFSILKRLESRQHVTEYRNRVIKALNLLNK